MTRVTEAAFARLPNCEVITVDNPLYESARRIFNGYIDRKPRAIIYPETIETLLAAGRLVLEREVPFAIRAGGHNVAGSSVIDDGYVIDTSRLSRVAVDRSSSLANVEPGALWRDFDSTCAKYGLCAPGGIISDTGVAGLTLGGGIGWLNGLYGLSCDSLAEADVLLSSGEVVTASDRERPDLLWALRGGGGNFGLVTRFRFQLHPLPSLLAGSIVYSQPGLEEAMQRYVECCDCAPDALTVSFVALTGPGLPRVSLDVCYAGDVSHGLALTNGLLPAAPTLLLKDSRQLYSYVNWQRMLDDDLRRGRRSYWRAIYVDDLIRHEFLAILRDYLASAPSKHSMLTIDHVHGKSLLNGYHTSAYGNRTNKYLFLINTNWDSVEEDKANLDWCDTLFRDIQAYSVPSTYVNYLSQEGRARVRSAFGENLPRLREVKRRYDPQNRFRSNQNIEPA
jgi:FAD/FMN-containing dehydrogenase